MKPICVKCERFFRPKKNGFWFVEGMPKENGAPPGLAEPHKWQPYKLWVGDLWECPTCGATIVVGVGAGAFSEHFKDDFTELCEQAGAELLVKDC